MTQPGEFDQVIVAYESDTGEIFTISQKRDNALALGNQIVGTRTNQGTPEMWRFRTIKVQTLTMNSFRVYQREYIICSKNNPLFTGGQNTVSIDGVLWRVTGRRGEDMRGPRAQ